jgi:ketosteroid isomerase-like protein
MSLSEQDVRTIRELSTNFMEFMVKKDFSRADEVYTEDAVLMPPDFGAVTGLAAIKDFLGGFPPIHEFENVVDDVDGRGDMAYVRGHFRMVMMPEAGAEPVVEEGQYLEIRKRQDDGSWPIAIDIFNPGV